MNILLRKAAPEDAEAINSLSQQLGYEATVAETEARLKSIAASESACVFVAVADKGVVGWIHGIYAQRLESAAFVEIGGLVVDANLRGAGIGKRLIRQVTGWSAGFGVSSIRVRTNTQRLRTHQFYLKAGFVEFKEQKVYELQV